MLNDILINNNFLESNFSKLDNITYFDINDKYITEAIRLHFIKNINNIYLYFDIKSLKDTLCFTKLKIQKQNIDKLTTILSYPFDKFNNKNSNNDNKENNNNNDLEIYLHFLNKVHDDAIIATETNINILLNKQSLEFILHKNFTRFNTFHKLNKYDLSKNDIIFGDVLLHFLGIVPFIRQINVLRYNESLEPLDNLNSLNMCIIDESSKSITSNNIKCEYDYFTILWPKLLNINNLKTIIYDPEYHAYYENYKIITLDLFIKLLQNILIPKSFANIHMFNKYNNNQISLPLCFPNLYIIDDEVKINTKEAIKLQLIEINNYLSSYSEKSINIPMCSELPHEIYFSKPERNIYTNGIIKYHNNVVNFYMSKFLDKYKLLDVGAGPLRQILFYEKIGIKKLIAIEPSQASIETGLEKYKNECKFIDLVMIPGFGEEDWELPKYKQVLINKPYKSILFKFTIHYMLSNLDQLLLNLNNVSIKGTKVMVTCLNGDIVLNKLEQYGKYEIKNDGQVLYGLYNYEDIQNTEFYKKVMVYFKGVYGVESGSIEFVVSIDYLIKKFKEYSFKLVLNENFMQINFPKLVNIRKDYNKAQKLVSELHNIIIFERF
ncbi:mRNA capping enzyme [Hokovirus HKV1]|uniref:mRNA capping enzyme n=1 Tax=Hokovirus HKV1 TaxID=1977638 RepID=A0A1V0SG53_9VIRU|nr:mRNA capping enzyme [Hokovirus HKV1]